VIVFFVKEGNGVGMLRLRLGLTFRFVDFSYEHHSIDEPAILLGGKHGSETVARFYIFLGSMCMCTVANDISRALGSFVV